MGGKSNPDRNERIVRAFLGGATRRQIADEMGITKNVVVGVLARAGLASGLNSPIKRGPSKQVPTVRDRQARCGGRPLPRWNEGRIPMIGGVVFRSCQFIEGKASADDGCKCSKPTVRGSAYCKTHHRRCYRPLTEKDLIDGEAA